MRILKIQIHGLNEPEYKKFFFIFLIYKLSQPIKSVHLEIIFNNTSVIETKNEYLYYSNAEIKKNLKRAQVNASKSSGINVLFRTDFGVLDEFNADKTIFVKAYLILEFFTDIDIIHPPIKFNEDNYRDLYYTNDNYAGYSYNSTREFDINKFFEITKKINDYIRKDETGNYFFLTQDWYNDE